MRQRELNGEALHAACIETARRVLWQPKEKKQPTENEVEVMAKRFEREALHHLEFVVSQRRDPNLLVRAVRYLAYVHAMPPMRDDICWFSDMLDVLVELACPNAGLPPRGKEFVTDIRRGLSGKLKS
jgi:hypothetical protein